MAFMESTSISVLVNGTPTYKFRPTRGLRQGNPITPFLYLVVVEDLIDLVREALKKQLL